MVYPAKHIAMCLLQLVCELINQSIDRPIKNIINISESSYSRGTKAFKK